ncbi:MAG: undecaprenyl/decaprenyl-phosphate alpha-N-acetylglucosaminyl 1-phosphate transferase [Myxococcales bacterium]|nr:MAG: undecaprenyl/decaprenyl-phosphate alpha-N-acetylglucosaminyl 1-phosphate transferase [Myxococcales bacterium]
MLSSLTAFLISVLCAALFTPLVRIFAHRVGAVDTPGGRRVNERAIPRMGGLAVAAAFFVPFIALFLLDTGVARVFFAEPSHAAGLVFGGLLVCGLGALDDLRGVRAWHKLAVQIAAALVAFYCGYRIDAVNLPGMGILQMGIFAAPVTVLWIVAIINALNLIDGLDGLAAGIAFFACVTNFVVAVIGHNDLVMLLAASLGGAVLGFLVYNFNPASIFMGDSGSMFLGYVLATMSLLGSAIKSSTTVAILVPLVALGVPIMDTLLAMARRFLERRPIFSPDRGHIHHRLLELGLTHRRAVLILYGFSVVFTVGAITLALGRNWQVGGAIIVLSIVFVGLIRLAGNLDFSRLLGVPKFNEQSGHSLPQAVLDYVEELMHASSSEEIHRVLHHAKEQLSLDNLRKTAARTSVIPVQSPERTFALALLDALSAKRLQALDVSGTKQRKTLGTTH